MYDYISGDVRAETKEAAEEVFQFLNLICYVFHPELEASKPKFKGTYFHVYLRKKREKSGVWRAEKARYNGGIWHPLPPLTEKTRKRLEEYLSGCYN